LNASETANARIWCLSLKFQQGSDSNGDTLELSTISESSNGELAPANDGSYVSGFTLDISGLPLTGVIHLNLPDMTDANGDGWPDFFEVSQAVGGPSAGTYSTPLGGGQISASWSRGAGSKDGTCVMTLTDNTYGMLGDFPLGFELLEYTGPLTYTPGSNAVNGTISLTKTGDSTSQMQGPIQFVKNATNRFNLLMLQPGAWTNAAMQMLTYTNDVYQRDQGGWPTNYYGYVEFDDGDPSTASPDYYTWILSIDDPNDANHNGIPDFSDDPSAVLPVIPILSLALNSTNLQLTITGQAGSSYQLQQTTNFPATWQTTQTLTLTNSAQVLVLPPPTAPTTFWRLLANP
jgi:hypothetical protein